MLLLPLMQKRNTLYIRVFFPGQVKEGCWGAYELGNSLSFINLYLEQRDRVGGNSVLP